MSFCKLRSPLLLALPFVLSFHSCKSRETRDQEGLSSFAQLSEKLENGGLVRLSDPGSEKTSKVLVYVHGWSQTGKPEDFLKELAYAFAPHWQRAGFDVYAYTWSRRATGTPFEAQEKLWSVEAPQAGKALRDLLSEKVSQRRESLDELRVVGQSLGSQLAILMVYGLVDWDFGGSSDILKKTRLEILDPYIPRGTGGQDYSFKASRALDKALAAGLHTPVIYASVVSDLTDSKLEAKPHVQHLSKDWVFEDPSCLMGKHTIDRQHNCLKRAYFQSLLERSPRYLLESAPSDGGQAFSASLPTSEFFARTEATESFQIEGEETLSFADDVFGAENPGTAAQIEKLFEELKSAWTQKPQTQNLQPSSLRRLSQQVAVNTLTGTAQSAFSDFAKCQSEGRNKQDCADGLRYEIDDEIKAMKARLGQPITSTQSPPQETGFRDENGCLVYSIDKFISLCSGEISLGRRNQCLGLETTETVLPLDDYKRCYRTLAKAYHPDTNPGNQKAQAAFAILNTLYSTVSK